jgi:hypothetical protein
MADGDFAGLASLFCKTKGSLGAIVVKVLHREFGDGANASSSLDHDGN